MEIRKNDLEFILPSAIVEINFFSSPSIPEMLKKQMLLCLRKFNTRQSLHHIVGELMCSIVVGRKEILLEEVVGWVCEVRCVG